MTFILYNHTYIYMQCYCNDCNEYKQKQELTV